LSSGFKYLGYYLKPGSSKSDDWSWLVAKIEKKIGLWCNKWLSLRGRFILVKAMLESLSVFWMSMEVIPRTILNKIRKLSFAFLWSGHKEKFQFHLCRWDLLARPKICGGWGLINLPTFNSALLANTFWRALTHGNIWNIILLGKYLGNSSIFAWLRKSSHQQQRASSFWNGMTRNIFVILHWLRWIPGSGNSISIGRELIIGLENRSLLSESLRLHLSNNHITSLAQARDTDNIFSFPGRWRSSDSLSLGGQDAIDWNSFINSLRGAGIILRNSVDTLVWVGGDSSSVISAKNLYHELINSYDYQCDSSWFKKLWKWPIQLKIKLFVWLAAKDKVLTWELLQRKGWQGPGVCKLCNCSSENINHLLIHCSLMKSVWLRLYDLYRVKTQWVGNLISDCFMGWTKDKSAPASLVATTC
jgi:hypothetical protein